MKINKRKYTKKAARDSLTPLGRLFFRCGACSLYLDYQVWRVHVHWWHPFSWLAFLIVVMHLGLGEIPEMLNGVRVPKEDRKYSYRGAA